jgi:hypothetical protein
MSQVSIRMVQFTAVDTARRGSHAGLREDVLFCMTPTSLREYEAKERLMVGVRR